MFKKIMSTEDHSGISSVTCDPWKGSVYAFSSSGDTYVVSAIPQSWGHYGPLSVFSSVEDGNGDRTATMSFGMVYELFDAVVSASRDSFSAHKAVGVYSAQSPDTVYGRYVSEVLSPGDGFGYWRDISWSQSTPGNSFASISVKVADDVQTLLASDWMHRYAGEESYQYAGRMTLPLDRFNLHGRFMMFMVELTSDSPADIPYVADMAVSYVGSHSVYFFSDSIRIESGYPENMILTASMSVPRKTEIIFGVGPGGSGDWKDYIPVDLDRISSIPKSFGKRFKVGARLSSYDLSEVPVIHEFALSFEAPTNNEVNL